MTAFRILGRLMRALAASLVLLALVAGLPWALGHYIGWPLPDHLPTTDEVQAVLLSPLSTPLLLDVLACLCWITWAAFVIDVTRCALAALRGLRWSDLQIGGPVHAIAAVLVGAIVVCLLSTRTPSTGLATNPTPPPARSIALVHLTAPEPGKTVVVRTPEHGIHDSLSRIAARTLGDARRWPEIFKVNKGKHQPNGGTFTNPNLIFPGERLTLPFSILPTPTPTNRAVAPTVSAPVPPRSAPAATTPTPTPPTSVPRGFGPGIGWEPGVFVGLGLAAAISAAVSMAWRRYRPGSGRRDDLPAAPVVYQLRLAHLRAEHDGGEHGDSPSNPGLGERDGREIALDLAAARGLGLVGPGAFAAARALLLAMLTPGSAVGAQMIAPADDLALLLGPEHSDGKWPATLRVVPNLDAALDGLETETLRRVRQDDPAARAAWPVLALVTRPPQQNTQRLQAVLDNGAHLGLVGVLLGQWRAGISAYIRADGTVSATSPGPGQALLGTRMFHLPEAQTAELLTLLHHAQPDPPSRPEGPSLELTAIPTTKPELTTPQLRRTPAADHGDHPARPIRLTVLGTPRIHWIPDSSDAAQEITAAFSPRQREFLVYLALHSDGVHRDPLVATLWQDSPPERPTNALNTALSRLRRALHAATDGALSDITTAGEGRYQLDPHLVNVDYWHLCDAITAQRAANTDSERIAAYQQIVDCYRGVLAEGLDTAWIEAPREAARRDALDAVAALARALVNSDPQRTLDLLETTRAFDPHNELLYRDIMRLQERLGHLDAIPRTLTLLTTRLAEIDETPTTQAVDLAARLQQRHDTTDADVARDHAHAR